MSSGHVGGRPERRALRYRRRSVDARPTLREARRQRRRTAARASRVRAVHRHRRTRPLVSGADHHDPDRPQRRHLGRRAHPHVPSAAARALARRAAGHRPRRAVHAARDHGRPQSGALARRLRADRARGCARRAHGRVDPAATLGAGGRDVLLVRHGAAIRLTRACVRERRTARDVAVQRGAAGRRTVRAALVAARRAARVPAQPELLGNAGEDAAHRRPRRPRSRHEFDAAAIEGDRVEPDRALAAAGAREGSGDRLPLRAARARRRHCAQPRAPAARRRARAARARGLDRPPFHQRPHHARTLPADRLRPAALIVGVRSASAPTGVRSGGGGPVVRGGRLAPRARRHAREERARARADLRAVSRIDDRRAHRDRRASASCTRAGSR